MQATKIYVISLERMPERRKFMDAQLSALGLEAEFVEAVDGLELSEATLKANYKHTYGGMSPTEIGCAWSHRNVYKRLIDSQEEYALVLEDDAVLAPDIVQFLEIIPKIASDWELISLYWWCRWFSAKPHIFRSRFPLNLYNQRKFELGGSSPRKYRLGEFLLPIGGAVGYLVSRQGAQLLMRHNTPIVSLADYLFGNITPGKLLAVKPELVFIGSIDLLGSGIMSRSQDSFLLPEKSRTPGRLIRRFTKSRPYGNRTLPKFVERLIMTVFYLTTGFRTRRK